jgi:hypothetical protein
VALSAIKLSGNADIRSLKPTERKCYFSDEIDTIKIHKNYSQSNCMLECSLSFAKESLKTMLNLTNACTPWYYPSQHDDITVCSPWEALKFNQLMNDVPDSNCLECLPDCDSIIYEPTITALPFRSCNSANKGVSPMCDLENDLVNKFISSRTK